MAGPPCAVELAVMNEMIGHHKAAGLYATIVRWHGCDEMISHLVFVLWPEVLRGCGRIFAAIPTRGASCVRIVMCLVHTELFFLSESVKGIEVVGFVVFPGGTTDGFFSEAVSYAVHGLIEFDLFLCVLEHIVLVTAIHEVAEANSD